MAISLLHLFLFSQLAASVAIPSQSHQSKPVVSRDLTISPHSVPLSRRNHHAKRYLSQGSTAIRPFSSNQNYAVEVKFNGVPRYLQIDTGSADTWMIGQDYQCLSPAGDPVPTSECGLGDPYTGEVDVIPDINYYELYGSGSYISGIFGYACVEVAGLTIENQQVAVVNKASWSGGDNSSSGLLGLAPRLNTEAYAGTNTSNDTGSNIRSYSPVFETMYNESHLIEPVFSLALQRGNNGGYLAFGGLPPVNFTNDFVTTDLVGLPTTNSTIKNVFYPVMPQGYTLNGVEYSSNYTALLDSGTYVNHLPTAIADQINAAFDPPAIYNSTYQVYITSCNATVPSLGITFAGKTFTLDKSDVFPFIQEGNVCATNVLRGLTSNEQIYPDGLFILGDVFLHNVVAVFDAGNQEIRLATHDY